MLAFLIVAQLSQQMPPQGDCRPTLLNGLMRGPPLVLKVPPSWPCPPLRDMLPVKKQDEPERRPVDPRRVG
jgi:hypothetical protein